MSPESDIRLLVVDDEQDFLDSVARCLRVAGFSGFSCLRSPHQALELIRQQGAVVLLVDMVMPDMDGIELMQAAKALQPLTRCIIISGSPDARDAEECLGSGAFAYLHKPIAPEELLRSIREALAAVHPPDQTADA